MGTVLNRTLNFLAGMFLVFLLLTAGTCLLPNGQNPLTEGARGLLTQLTLATCHFNISRFNSSCVFRSH